MGRLNASAEHGFSGRAIDRSRQVRFTLDGYPVTAFAGDTVLSALMAAGTATLGTHSGHPVALEEGFAPSVYAAGTLPRPETLVPLDLVPVREGAALRTLGGQGHGPLRRWVDERRGAARASLNLDLDRFDLRRNPDGIAVSDRQDADLIVVGGGVAGLEAAVAAGKAGARVILIERRAVLGGDAELFGSRAGEAKPDELIENLIAQTSGLENVAVWQLSDAIAVRSGAVTVQQATWRDGVLASRFAEVCAPAIVLATGCADRLPIFPGNRLPGVTGLGAAFRLAQSHGVWPGDENLVASGVNSAYRLGMLARDAGRGVVKICDTRIDPRSRFIDFAKSYGLKLAAGTRVQNAVRTPAGRLAVALGLAFAEGTGSVDVLEADRLVVNEGWLPRLTLWRQAGGECAFGEAEGGLCAAGEVPGVALAGSAAGVKGTQAAASSGRDAVAQLFGRDREAIEDRPLPEEFESPDAALYGVLPPDTNGASYLAAGDALSLVGGPAAPRPRFGLVRPQEPEIPPNMPGSRALELAEIEALTRLGFLTPERLDAVASERLVAPVALAMAPPPDMVQASSRDADTLPAFLDGRFGTDPIRCTLRLEAGLLPETGSLIYLSSDTGSPFDAIGVIIGGTNEGADALMSRDHGIEGNRIAVREINRTSAGAIVSLQR